MSSVCIHSKVSMTEYFNIELLEVSFKVKGIRDAIIKIFDLAANQVYFPTEKVIQSLIAFKGVVLNELPHPNHPNVPGINIWNNTRIVVVFDITNGNCQMSARWIVNDSKGVPVMHSRGYIILSTFRLFDPDKF